MKVIVPLRSKSWAELAPKLDQIDGRVDIVELWIDQLFMDLMRNPQLISQVTTTLQQLKKEHDLSILAVCKSAQEQGNFGGNPTQRIELLKAFLQLGGDIIDVDVKLNDKALVRSLPKAQAWISLHDFVGIPENLESLARDMKFLQPAVYKFAVHPNSEEELQNFIDFAEKFSAHFPAIFTTMGPFGQEGRERLKKYTYGAFYALNENEATASGQPTLADL